MIHYQGSLQMHEVTGKTRYGRDGIPVLYQLSIKAAISIQYPPQKNTHSHGRLSTLHKAPFFASGLAQHGVEQKTSAVGWCGQSAALNVVTQGGLK